MTHRALRKGHTLFEICLVAAVLVIVGFLSLPLVGPMFSSNKAQSAQDMVRARFAEMRLHAMNDGKPYRFAYQENTGSFRIAPDDPQFWGDDGAPSGTSDQGWVVESELPKDIVFCASDAATVPSAGATSSQGWTRALTYLPDGTAREDVVVAFGKAGSRSLTLRVQSALGVVVTGDTNSDPK